VRTRTLVAVLFVFISVAWTAKVSTQAPPSSASSSSSPEAVREGALRRAQVWLEPATPIQDAKLGENPAGPGHLADDEVVPCQFRPGGTSGSTPKFDCELADGDTVKVKYGSNNAEVYAEVAASRLLAALGFAADRMYVVKSVRCFGCPKDPFEGLQCLNEGASARARIETCFPGLDYSKSEDFEHAVIERSLKGRRIETEKERGWSWSELGKIDPSAGGASRAQVDALRLMAVFLGHWDNKSKNQRLICLDKPCDRTLAMIQDLGGSFGPFKLELKGWADTPLWSDAATCAVSMRAMPYEGSSFPDTRISEEGRAFLASGLSKLSTQQIRDLFEGARVAEYPHKNQAQHDIGNWVRAFQEKVRAVVDRAPCPAS
jgi:hypothetical protein